MAGPAWQEIVTGAQQVNNDILGAVNTGMNWHWNQKNYDMQQENYAYQKALQQKIFDREDNAVQRRVRDLEAAGINPLLAGDIGGAGAGTPISTTAPVGQATKIPQVNFTGSITEALQMMKTLKEIDAIDATARKDDAQAGLFGAQAGDIDFSQWLRNKGMNFDVLKFGFDREQWEKTFSQSQEKHGMDMAQALQNYARGQRDDALSGMMGLRSYDSTSPIGNTFKAIGNNIFELDGVLKGDVKNPTSNEGKLFQQYLEKNPFIHKILLGINPFSLSALNPLEGLRNANEKSNEDLGGLGIFMKEIQDAIKANIPFEQILKKWFP